MSTAWERLQQLITSRADGVTPLAQLLKGDVEGHEFHGNQYTGGEGGDTGKEAPKDWQSTSGKAAQTTAREFMKQAIAQPTLSKEQSTSLISYVNSSRGMNDYLRNGIEPWNGDKGKQEIEAIKSVMQETTTKEPMVLFRGAPADVFGDVKVGDIITDKGFVSTSLLESGATRQESNAIMQIHAPEGTHCAAPLIDPLVAPSAYAHEAEVVLPPNTSFHVDDIKADGTYVVSVVPTATKNLAKAEQTTTEEHEDSTDRFVWKPGDILITKPATKAERTLLSQTLKGDVEGHEFHGNQYTGGEGDASQPDHIAFIGKQASDFAAAGGTTKLLQEGPELKAARADTSAQADTIGQRYEAIIEEGNRTGDPSMYEQADRLAEGIDYMDTAAQETTGKSGGVLVAYDSNGVVCAALDFKTDSNGDLHVGVLGSNKTVAGAATALQLALASEAADRGVGVISEATPDARAYHERIGRTLSEPSNYTGGKSTWTAEQCAQIAKIKVQKAMPKFTIDAKHQPSPEDLDNVSPIWSTKIGREMYASIKANSKSQPATKSELIKTLQELITPQANGRSPLSEALSKDFNPDEARGADGKWVSSGDSGATTNASLPDNHAGSGPHEAQPENATTKDPSQMKPQERQDAARALRAQGKTLQQVADALGYKTPQQARQAIIASQKRADAAAAASGGSKPEAPKPEATTQPESTKAEGSGKPQATGAIEHTTLGALVAGDVIVDVQGNQSVVTGIEPQNNGNSKFTLKDLTTGEVSNVILNGGLPVSAYSRDLINPKEQGDRALLIRNAGLTLSQVATALNYPSPQTARAAIISADKRAGSSTKPSSVVPEGAGKVFSRLQSAKAIQAQQYEVLRAAGREDLATSKRSDQEFSGPFLKENTCAEIASRMTGTSTAELIALSKENTYSSATVHVIKVDDANNTFNTWSEKQLDDAMNPQPAERLMRDTRWNSMVMVMFPDEATAIAADKAGGCGQKLVPDPSGVGSIKDPAAEYKSMSASEIDTAARAIAVSPLIQTWAGTSNNSDISQAIQETAAKEFGITRYAGWPPDTAPGVVNSEVQRQMDEHAAALKEFVHAQYDTTQAALARSGLKPDDVLTLDRGVKNVDAVKQAAVGEKLDFAQRPLSSFAWRPDETEQFTNYKGGVFEGQVKVKNIFGMPGFGFGCALETEVVVLASEENILTKGQLLNGEVLTKRAAKALDDDAPFSGMDYSVFINIDASIEDADWPKVSWDFPGIVDLPTFVANNGLDPDDRAAIEDMLKAAMALFSWQAAPDELQHQADAYLKGGALPPYKPQQDDSMTSAKALLDVAYAPVVDTLYEMAVKQVLAELAAVDAELEALAKDWTTWDEEHPYIPHPRQSAGAGPHGLQRDQAAASTVGMTSIQRQDEALRMRNEGKTLQEISDKLNFGSPQAARQGILAAQARAAAGGVTPTTPTTPTTTPEPTKPEPTSEPVSEPVKEPATTPAAEPQSASGATTEGSQTLPPEVIAGLVSAREAMQPEMDKAEAMMRSSDPAEQKAGAEKGLELSNEMGRQITEAIDAHFVPPAEGKVEGAVTAEEKAAAAAALSEKIASLDMVGRMNELAGRVQNAQYASLAAPYTDALRAAGVPEGHPAYDIVNDPQKLKDAIGAGYNVKEVTDPNLGTVKFATGWVGQTVTFNGEPRVRVAPTSDQLTAMKNVGVRVDNKGALDMLKPFALVATLSGGRVLTGQQVIEPNRSRVPAAVQKNLAEVIGVKDIKAFADDATSLREQSDKIKEMDVGGGKAASAHADAIATAYRELTLNTIGALRPLASAGDYPLGKVTAGIPRTSGMKPAAGMARTVQAIETATTRFPKDWVDNVGKQFGTIPFKFKNSYGEGAFSYNNAKTLGEIMVGKTAANEGDIKSGRSLMESTLQHEMAHSCQSSTPGIRQIEEAFFETRRTPGYNEKQGLPGYGKSVKGDPDKFHNPYTGRNYSDRGPQNHNEIISTGYEGLITPALTDEQKTNHSATFEGDKGFQHFITGMVVMVGRTK